MLPEISPIVAFIASVVAIFAGPLSVYYAYKKYKLDKETKVLRAKLEGRFYDVRTLGTRLEVINECNGIFLRARKGDAIFTYLLPRLF